MNADELPRFASFGVDSHLSEPHRISCPERIDIGDGVYIGPGAWLSVVDDHNGRAYEPRLWIGDGASLGPDVVIACISEVSIGPRVLTGPRVFIGDAYHDFRDPERAVIDQPMSDPAPVIVGEGAFLGVHSAILPGVTIGEHAYVAANAVVTHDVPARSVVAGNPARVIRRWDPEAREWRPPAGVEVADSEAVALAAMRERMAHLEARLSNGERRRAELVRELADATRRREAAEHWLAELERSPSWRATEPLRQLKRAAGRRGRRT